MSSMNKVILIGRLGRDPETRYMPSGEAVCNFSLATSESWNDKKSGNKVERTEWHNISMYGRLAEIAGQYLKKGSLTYIEGRIQSRKYTDKMGVERTAYDIVANEMKMLGGKNDMGGEDRAWDNSPKSYGNNTSQNDYNDEYARPDSPPPAAPQQRKAPVAPVAPVDDIDDDIPF
ncbi:single-stranded DNA-binding protein [Alysiella filiformis]|uniref:Single-stranded DNA-binding protein n=1 Tax=Alysiella filiformis DSM 16848 TaxID=1120981 RepID=A0A286EJX0_9NEIS|nr:single-stranded DNA-binding protein [Alysiella filiformis]QMT30694.1 single-stranded DNA-binding protein [Alysiella filiformis]UBQ56326.1 single-stranded DNA-binding protein [Alysiella filiformis DSM 16848]SOD71235.1 single-strand DNA-binding protein [Alysiella filiformis DSM 16848]